MVASGLVHIGEPAAGSSAILDGQPCRYRDSRRVHWLDQDQADFRPEQFILQVVAVDPG